VPHDGNVTTIVITDDAVVVTVTDNGQLDRYTIDARRYDLEQLIRHNCSAIIDAMLMAGVDETLH